MSELKLLVKYPTRGRPEKFFAVLSRYYSFLRGENFEFVISCDTDDATMNNPEVRARLASFPKLRVSFSDNQNKIQACNADLEGADFDVLLLASDDMIPLVPGYDLIIKENMEARFPDLDGVLWFFDGVRRELDTLSILGKKYYDRFGYIYYPGYQTWYCDNEFTAVAQALGKLAKFDQVIILHQHPGAPPDGPKVVNERFDETFWRNNQREQVGADETIYKEREGNGFRDGLGRVSDAP